MFSVLLQKHLKECRLEVKLELKFVQRSKALGDGDGGLSFDVKSPTDEFFGGIG